jgi:hypothetical protein
MENTQNTTTAKLPMLKQNEFEMWRLRIEQYFLVQDYALWDIIQCGDSFKPGFIESTVEGKSVHTLDTGPATNEERLQKRNDQKA